MPGGLLTMGGPCMWLAGRSAAPGTRAIVISFTCLWQRLLWLELCLTQLRARSQGRPRPAELGEDALEDQFLLRDHIMGCGRTASPAIALWTSLAEARRYGRNIGDIDHTVRLACGGNVVADFVPRRIHEPAGNLGNVNDINHAIPVEIVRGERAGCWRELGCVDIRGVVADHPELARIGVCACEYRRCVERRSDTGYQYPPVDWGQGVSATVTGFARTRWRRTAVPSIRSRSDQP